MKCRNEAMIVINQLFKLVKVLHGNGVKAGIIVICRSHNEKKASWTEKKTDGNYLKRLLL